MLWRLLKLIRSTRFGLRQTLLILFLCCMSVRFLCHENDAFCRHWLRILTYIVGIRFRVMHIFRKENKVEDALAAPSMETGVWFVSLPNIQSFVDYDFYGNDFHRIVH